MTCEYCEDLYDPLHDFRDFDSETRACTDYDNRPDMCREYPWYGREPRTDAALPPDCSFREDLIQIGSKP